MRQHFAHVRRDDETRGATHAALSLIAGMDGMAWHGDALLYYQESEARPQCWKLTLRPVPGSGPARPGSTDCNMHNYSLQRPLSAAGRCRLPSQQGCRRRLVSLAALLDHSLGSFLVLGCLVSRIKQFSAWFALFALPVRASSSAPSSCPPFCLPQTLLFATAPCNRTAVDPLPTLTKTHTHTHQSC